MNNTGSNPGERPDADVLRFPRQFMPEHDDLLTTQECIQYFLSRWRHPSIASHQLAEAIIRDAGDTDEDNDVVGEKRLMLGKIIETSQLFERYDELIEVDSITRLLDSLMRSSLSDKSIALERKAAGKLMYIRAAEALPYIQSSEQSSGLGDEREWEEILKRLFGSISSDA